MARCTSCSAPLAANTNICLYCRTRNDIDLQHRYDYSKHSHESDRTCPHCDIPLHTINLNIDGGFYIERCDQCFGLFFDPGEIESLMEHSVSPVFNINDQQITNISNERYQKHKKVKYVKCPVCRTFMKRTIYGHRSGVVIDQCKEHGIWLDSGEITQLLEWKKAGGQILHEKVAQRKEHQKRTNPPPPPPKYQREFSTYEVPNDAGAELVESVLGLLGKLFR